MDRLRKSSKTMRRALAALLAFAMSLSPVAVPATSDAAAKKPALNAKKKTLFSNQAGKKSFTLKIKKNKNIKVKKTTWKTTNKKVASISSKKKTAVKVTAKKAGKATIKATVNYTLKGSKKVKKTTLKCKVTSKSYTAPVQTVVPSAAPSASASAPAATATATATASAAPTNKPTTEPTAVPTVEPTSEPTAEPTTAPTSEPTTEPTAAPTTAPTSEPTAAPTAAPTEAPVAETISAETAIATIGVAKDINTVTLSATVKDQNGAAMSDAVITWSSDKADIASVDKNGVVTEGADAVDSIKIAYGTEKADKLPAKAVEVKFEKQNDAKFADVKAAITVNADRKVSSITVGTEAQTALVGVATAANKITVKDQYDTVKEGAALEYVVLGSDGKATKDAEVNFNAYDPASKTYSVEVTAEKAGTYSVIVYVNDNTGSEATNGYDAKDTQAKAFTVTAGEPSDMIASIKLAKLVEVKDASLSIAVGDNAFVVVAKDQYGEDATVNTAKFYSVVSTNESFATVACENEVITVTRKEGTAGSAKATIKVEYSRGNAVNFEVKGIADKKIELKADNTDVIQYGNSVSGALTLEEGKATVKGGTYHALKVSFELPEGVSLKDYSGVRLKVKQIEKNGKNDISIGSEYGENCMFVVTKLKGKGYIQTSLESENDLCKIAEYNPSKNVGISSVQEIMLPFAFDSEPDAVTGKISIAIGIAGINAGAYQISDITLVG